MEAAATTPSAAASEPRPASAPVAPPEAGDVSAPMSPSAPAALAEVSCVSIPGPASVSPASSQILPPSQDRVGRTDRVVRARGLVAVLGRAGVRPHGGGAGPTVVAAGLGPRAGRRDQRRADQISERRRPGRAAGTAGARAGAPAPAARSWPPGPTADALLGWNGRRVGAAGQSDFSLDPHPQHSTGMAAVLKGWGPTIRWADTALHSDFLHPVTGQPIDFECTDNYEDLRGSGACWTGRVRRWAGPRTKSSP